MLYRARLSAPDNFAQWRGMARQFLAADIPPDRIWWGVGGDPPDLFGEQGDFGVAEVKDAGFSVPRGLLGTMRAAMLHRDRDRFALAYRILWRLRMLPTLAGDAADPDIIALSGMARDVRRDLHKMHAFVRFRKVGEANGRESFAAWFEPGHHIGRAVAGFFRDRFAGMDWLIVTPEVSIGWDGETLREGPGGNRGDVPIDDAVEAEWKAYYASIFNPARVKTKAMKKEMPVRYWRNLPEAVLIPDLVRNAEGRVDAMARDSGARTDKIATDVPIHSHDARQFASLAALYAALEREDVAPSPGFSEVIVRGEGPDNAAIMLVGEQPGDQEDQLSRPFVGPAGQLLDVCLARAGIGRDTIYLTNAVKRFKFSPRGKRRIHSTPSASDIAHYRWWLKEEIHLVNPAVVIALGATALQSLSGRRQALAPLRGRVMGWEDRSLIVTIHPSYLLRLPDEQARAIEREKFIRDLQLSPAPR